MQFLFNTQQYLGSLRVPISCFIWCVLHLTRLGHFTAQEKIPDYALWNKRIWFTEATRRPPYSHTSVLLLPRCPRQNLRHCCGMHCPAAVIKFNNSFQQTRQEKDSGETNTHKQSDSPGVMLNLCRTKETHFCWLLKPQSLAWLCPIQI